MKRKICIQIITAALLFAFSGIMFFRHYSNRNNTMTAVKKEMQACLDDLRKKSYTSLADRIIKLENSKSQISDKLLRSRIEENCTMLAMIHAAMTGNDEEAIKIFQERHLAKQGKKFDLICFDDILPYAKFHVLNIFLKRFDLRGAYLFVSLVPKVETGPYVPYFKAMDDFINGDISGSLRQLEQQLKQQPQNKMIINSIAYIKRVEKKDLILENKEKSK